MNYETPMLLPNTYTHEDNMGVPSDLKNQLSSDET
jgi:hypothetical protein